MGNAKLSGDQFGQFSITPLFTFRSEIETINFFLSSRDEFRDRVKVLVVDNRHNQLSTFNYPAVNPGFTVAAMEVDEPAHFLAR